ncbi:Asp-tRNA(Asn)/Glu-tRNA(Gln) amidotransferase subunit GatC [Thalassoroseus pseudoceratinae]|uniref:Asp-tRNA(Asn)/Glu-tRNA(Gln) amidotransferase subunit GatC n=1 Tax=Thalassoroseus pseudoceratinae TaxID=2713176 RepID=UPI00141FABAD|nr:Asp-tRNA(Asn)/Glu-tRNA(Gln) amidotransferase subunit GatC [Thalassoroseus pseudoceratinae]
MSTPKPLSADDVRKVAVLARLKLSDSQIERFTEQLGDVLQYVRLLDEVDIEGVEPMAHAVEVTNVLRDDVPTPSLNREAALQNAPQTDGKTFRVPAVFGGE